MGRVCRRRYDALRREARRSRQARVAAAFKLEPAQQAKLAKLAFWATACSVIAVLYGRHGFAPVPPAAMLLGAAAWRLHAGYVPALLSADKSACSLELGKIKTLLFFALVVAAVFELLSADSPIAIKP